MLILFGIVICINSVNILLKDGTEYVATTLTFGALVFHWTRIADLDISFVNDNLLALTTRIPLQYLPLRANVMILFGVIVEEIGIIIPAPLAQVWNRNKSLNSFTFQSGDVWGRAILSVAGDSFGI